MSNNSASDYIDNPTCSDFQKIDDESFNYSNSEEDFPIEENIFEYNELYEKLGFDLIKNGSKKENFVEDLSSGDNIINSKSQQQSNISDNENDNNTCIKNQTQKSINEKDSAIYSKEDEIANITSTLQALNESKQKLQSKTSDDAQKQAEISQKLKEVEEKITEVTNEKAQKETELQQLKSEKETMEADLTGKQQDLEKLQSEKSNIDAQISNQGSQATKDALNAYNSSKENIDTVKQQELQQVQQAMSQVENDLNEINTALREKQAKETKKEYKAGTADLFTDSGYNIQKVNRDGMDYVVIGPQNADPNEELPVMVYLHGLHSSGNDLDQLNHSSMMNLIKSNSDKLGKTFNGYIIMPQSPTTTWKSESHVNEVKQIVNEFSQSHAVDMDNIALAGNSMGGTGVLYMAGHNQDNFFKRGLVMSGYNPGKSALKNINIPIYGVSGSGEDNDTKSLVKSAGQDNNYTQVDAGHSEVTKKAFYIDSDGDGCSDMIQWLFPEYAA